MPAAGTGIKGWKRLVVEFLKGDSFDGRQCADPHHGAGQERLASRPSRGKDSRRRPGNSLTPKPRLGYLRSVEAMNRNLVALSRMVMPHVSVVDGFHAMHREGPRHGTPIRLGTVIAGTDAVAVDAVAAAVMGFDPRSIGYIRYADEAGLGVADLGSIAILGDPIASVARPCVPHSNHVVQRHWSGWRTCPARLGPSRSSPRLIPGLAERPADDAARERGRGRRLGRPAPIARGDPRPVRRRGRPSGRGDRRRLDARGVGAGARREIRQRPPPAEARRRPRAGALARWPARGRLAAGGVLDLPDAPRPGWLASLAGAIRSTGAAGVGGPIEAGEGLTRTDRAVALLRYSNYFRPCRSSSVPSLRGKRPLPPGSAVRGRIGLA